MPEGGEGSQYLPRMHPDDLAALVKAWQAGVANPRVPPGAPPADLTGADAARWQHLEDLLDKRLGTVCTEILQRCEDRMLSLLGDLQMPMRTEENRIATRKRMDAVFAIIEGVQSWRREFFSRLVVASAGWVVAVISVGVSVFFARGGLH